VGGPAYGWLDGKEQVSGLLLEMCTTWLCLWFDVALLVLLFIHTRRYPC